MTTCNVFRSLVPLGLKLETRLSYLTMSLTLLLFLSKKKLWHHFVCKDYQGVYCLRQYMYTLYIHIASHKLISKSSDLQPSSPTSQIVAQSIKRAPHPHIAFRFISYFSSFHLLSPWVQTICHLYVTFLSMSLSGSSVKISTPPSPSAHLRMSVDSCIIHHSSRFTIITNTG